MSNSEDIKVAIFSCVGNGGGREDWDLCNLSLIQGLAEKGVSIYLIADEVSANSFSTAYIKPTATIKLIEILGSKVKINKCLLFLVNFLRNKDLILRLSKNPAHVLAFAIKTFRFISWLSKNNIKALISLNYWSDYAYIVCACKCYGIPAIAIQHANYYNQQSLENNTEEGPIKGTSHEWPSTHALLFSNEAISIFKKKYPSDQTKLYRSGWFPCIKWLVAKPTRINQIVIYESLNFQHLIGLSSALSLLLGKDNIRFRAHPARQTHDWLFKKHLVPALSSAEGLTQELPRLGISIGSSVSLELMSLRIPVIDLLPDEASCSKYWQFSFARWPELVHYLSKVLSEKNSMNFLLREQANDLPQYYKESSDLVRSRLVNIILEIVRQNKAKQGQWI